MFKALGSLGGMLASLAVALLPLSGLGVWWWDRRPPDFPAVHAKVLFIKVGWTAPDSLAAQLKAKDAELTAARRDLKQCRDNEVELNGAIARQNAAVDRLAAAGARQQAQAAAALSRQRSATSAAQARAAELLAHPPVGIDACQRFMDADAKLLESLR